MQRAVFILGPLVLAIHVLALYALPPKGLVAALFILGAIFYLQGWTKALLVALSFTLATACIELGLRVTNADAAIYYRPDELLSYFDDRAGHVRYSPNRSIRMVAPHGDLKARAPSLPVLPVSREILFVTDSLGFRNQVDYHGQNLLLVGDSFIVGCGMTQEDTVGEQLRRAHGIDTYSLGAPASVDEYRRMIQTFDNRDTARPRIVLFVFEGNDFGPSAAKAAKSALEPLRMLKAYYHIIKRARLFRFMFWRLHSLSRTRHPSTDVISATINDHTMAFYKPYIQAAQSPLLVTPEAMAAPLRDITNRLVHVFLIPTKYRVYHSMFADPAEPELPHAAWDCLQQVGRDLNIPVSDLTDPLVDESRRLLLEEKLTFWPDDTHWNGYGAAIAARCLAEVLQQADLGGPATNRWNTSTQKAP